jgi:hypothetical protein
MTIRTLASAIPECPEVGRVEVECKCGTVTPLAHFRFHQRPVVTSGMTVGPMNCDHRRSALDFILTCTEPGEVGEMVGVKEVCIECGDVGQASPVTCCTKPHHVPVTDCAFLWDGEPPKHGWEDLLHYRDAWLDLTAVVLVGELSLITDAGALIAPINPKLAIGREIMSRASRACAEAGVQFIVPGEGKLEL